MANIDTIYGTLHKVSIHIFYTQEANATTYVSFFRALLSVLPVFQLRRSMFDVANIAPTFGS